MCANLKGIVSEFEMQSDSMRMLNAGKWTCASEDDTEWEQAAALSCVTTSEADAFEAEMWNKMIDVTLACLQKGAWN